MSDPAPTFQNNRDRLTWLFAEYKILIGGMAIAAILLVGYYQVSLPSLPTWIPALLVGWLVLAIPCFLVGRKIAVWLRTRNWTTCYEVNAATGKLEKHKVPPAIWQNKKVNGPDPYTINGGSAWVVRDFEWLDDVEELRVTGVWLSGLEDTALFTAKSMMTDMHGWMLDQIEKLADTRAKWSRGVVQYEEKTVNDFAEARERGVTLDRTSGRDVFEDLSAEGDDDIPKLDTDDMPDIDDHKGLGSEMEDVPTQDEIDQARQREEQLQ